MRRCVAHTSACESFAGLALKALSEADKSPLRHCPVRASGQAVPHGTMGIDN